MEVEMAHNLRRDYEKGGEQLSAVLRQLIERGRGYAAVDYAAAVAGIPALNDALDPVFDEFDAIVTPAAPGEAPRGLASTGNPVFCTPVDLSRDAGADAAALAVGRGACRSACSWSDAARAMRASCAPRAGWSRPSAARAGGRRPKAKADRRGQGSRRAGKGKPAR